MCCRSVRFAFIGIHAFPGYCTCPRLVSPCDARALTALRKLDKEAEDARVTLEAVATGLKIITRSGRTATLNGERLPADASRRITEVADLEIKDVCQITVTPGGDLDELRDAHRKSAQKLGMRSTGMGSRT